MKIKISNFRGIKEAEFEPSKITAIFAGNHAGKTSLIQAIQAASTGDTVPLDITKKQISMLVHSGTASGMIQIDDGESNTLVVYPEAKLSTSGLPPKASGYAAGLESILTRTTDRANVFAEYLKILPTKELLKEAIPSLDISRLWETIEAQGWDSAFANAKQKGAKLKGQWETITGDNYGLRKAEAWTAPAYDPNVKKEELEKQVQDAQEWLEAALKYEAVNESEVERLEKESKDSEFLLAERENLENLRIGFIRQKDELIHKISGQESGETVEPCPFCHKEIIISLKRKLKKFKSIGTLTDNDIKKFRQDINAYNIEVVKIDKAIEENGFKSRTAAEAIKKLSKLKEIGKSNKPQANVEDCRKTLQFVSEKLKAYNDMDKVEKLKNNIRINKSICETLAPAGLRAECLKRALQDINKILRQLCEIGKWELVEIHDDLSITYKGMKLAPNHKKSLCSESEYYRAEIILQIAFAINDKSDFILIDRADILDKPGRNGLFAILNTIETKSIICFTWLNGRENLPDLSKLNGTTYWIEKGVLQNGSSECK